MFSLCVLMFLVRGGGKGGGGGAGQSKKEEMVEAGCQEKHRVGEVEIVSKICVYSLSEVAYE